MTMTFSTRHLLISLCAALLALPPASAWADNAEECQPNAEPEKAEAVYLACKRDAEQGDSNAQLQLGLMYTEGRGVERDYGEAVKWYGLSAKQGNVFAIISLGYLLVVSPLLGSAAWVEDSDECSWHVDSEDFQAAYPVCKEMAEQGNVIAQFHVGWMYYEGYGVEKDYEEGLKWFSMAAEQGDLYAQYNLGLAYYNGDGVAKDAQEAYVWFLLAANDGDENSEEAVEIVKKKLSDDQIRAAEEEAERRLQAIKNRLDSQ